MKNLYHIKLKYLTATNTLPSRVSISSTIPNFKRKVVHMDYKFNTLTAQALSILKDFDIIGKIPFESYDLLIINHGSI